MDTTASVRATVVVPTVALVVAVVLALGLIPLAAPASASVGVVSAAPLAQVGPPPGPELPPRPPAPGEGARNIPPFVLQILRAVLPLPILQLLESLGVLQPASP